ncbi:MAG: heat shock protein HspQ [Deltaproteobacteria bacterium]|nr:MAG: heat shock protein HspQ [Deltaproteobacteria bacterium]
MAHNPETRGRTPGRPRAHFAIGQVVHHRRFDYRGVVFDVDATYQGTDAWYEEMARSRPPKDRPWYHVLVHDADHTTYVAERNLEADANPAPIRHPRLDQLFDAFSEGRYVCTRRAAH